MHWNEHVSPCNTISQTGKRDRRKNEKTLLQRQQQLKKSRIYITIPTRHKQKNYIVHTLSLCRNKIVRKSEGERTEKQEIWIGSVSSSTLGSEGSIHHFNREYKIAAIADPFTILLLSVVRQNIYCIHGLRWIYLFPFSFFSFSMSFSLSIFYACVAFGFRLCYSSSRPLLSTLLLATAPVAVWIPLNNHNNSKPNWKISQIMYIRIRVYHAAEENSVLWFAAAPRFLRGRKNCTRLEKLRVKIGYLIAVDSIDSCQLNGIDREKTASFHIEIE